MNTDKLNLNLEIRPALVEDAADYWALMRHPQVARTTAQLPVQTLAQATERLTDTPKNLHRLMAVVDGRVVGCATLHHYNNNPRRAHSGGLGMAVHPDFWGRGIGTRLMEALLDLADNWLNLVRVELEVNTDNPAGIRLYEKMGFEREGLLRKHIYGDGRWADSYLMARIRLSH